MGSEFDDGPDAWDEVVARRRAEWEQGGRVGPEPGYGFEESPPRVPDARIPWYLRTERLRDEALWTGVSGGTPQWLGRVYGAAPGSLGDVASPGYGAGDRIEQVRRDIRDAWLALDGGPTGGEAGADGPVPDGPPRCGDCGQEHAWTRIGVVPGLAVPGDGPTGVPFDLRGAVVHGRALDGSRCRRCKRRLARRAFAVAVRRSVRQLRRPVGAVVGVHVRDARAWVAGPVRHRARVEWQRWRSTVAPSVQALPAAYQPLARGFGDLVDRGVCPVVAAAVDAVQGFVPYVTRWDYARWLVRQVATGRLPVRGAWLQWTNNPRQDAYSRRAARRRARQRFRLDGPPPVPRWGESSEEWVERVVRASRPFRREWLGGVVRRRREP